jgi:hypothetical protein
MPGGLKDWAQAKNPKEQAARHQAHQALREMPVSETGHGVAVPFPFIDRSIYKAHVSNREMNHRIRLAPHVEIPLKGLMSIQHSVKPRLVDYYIDNPGPDPTRVHPKTGTPTDVPIIVQIGGKMLLYDGNHRTTAAWLRGEKQIVARFVNLDIDPGQGGASSSRDAPASAKSKKSSSSSSS